MEYEKKQYVQQKLPEGSEVSQQLFEHRRIPEQAPQENVPIQTFDFSAIDFTRPEIRRSLGQGGAVLLGYVPTNTE